MCQKYTISGTHTDLRNHTVAGLSSLVLTHSIRLWGTRTLADHWTRRASEAQPRLRQRGEAWESPLLPCRKRETAQQVGIGTEVRRFPPCAFASSPLRLDSGMISSPYLKIQRVVWEGKICQLFLVFHKYRNDWFPLNIHELTNTSCLLFGDQIITYCELLVVIYVHVPRACHSVWLSRESFRYCAKSYKVSMQIQLIFCWLEVLITQLTICTTIGKRTGDSTVTLAC